jgi:Zn-finger nucleic acid-binding protein
VWNLRFNLHKRSALTCPKCLAKTLHTFNTSEGVTVDLCDKCRGMWMDKGETARAAELENDFPDYRAVAGSAVLTNFICPCCGSKLHNMKYATQSDLMIEYCRKCGGMFLDAGEMSKIETISANSESAGKKLVRCLKQMHDEGYVKLN